MSIHEEKDWLEDLGAAYEAAEAGNPAVGDTIIFPGGGAGYVVRHAADWDCEAPERWGIRILKRAPEPEPELQAVMAGYIADEHFDVNPAVRHVWTNRGGGYWESIVDFVHSDELVDPVPLVEVPDIDALREALERPYMHERREWPGSIPLARAVLELLGEKA